jgi:hypothetical protein
VTTPLVRPLTREVLVAGAAYRVLLTADRLTLTPKGRRKGAIEVTWDELLAWHARDVAPSATPEVAPAASPPRAVLTEIAREVRAAANSLSRADQTLSQAGALPPELRAEMATDPQHGRPEERQDWFIEPLLTVNEVASVLRLSTRAVRRLPIRTIVLAGEVRYRQSEIRAYLQKQESKVRAW